MHVPPCRCQYVESDGEGESAGKDRSDERRVTLEQHVVDWLLAKRGLGKSYGALLDKGFHGEDCNNEDPDVGRHMEVTGSCPIYSGRDEIPIYKAEMFRPMSIGR